jgi:hypothetical protein
MLASSGNLPSVHRQTFGGGEHLRQTNSCWLSVIGKPAVAGYLSLAAKWQRRQTGGGGELAAGLLAIRSGDMLMAASHRLLAIRWRWQTGGGSEPAVAGALSAQAIHWQWQTVGGGKPSEGRIVLGCWLSVVIGNLAEVANQLLLENRGCWQTHGCWLSVVGGELAAEAAICCFRQSFGGGEPVVAGNPLLSANWQSGKLALCSGKPAAVANRQRRQITGCWGSIGINKLAVMANRQFLVIHRGWRSIGRSNQQSNWHFWRTSGFRMSSLLSVIRCYW